MVSFFGGHQISFFIIFSIILGGGIPKVNSQNPTSNAQPSLVDSKFAAGHGGGGAAGHGGGAAGHGGGGEGAAGHGTEGGGGEAGKGAPGEAGKGAPVDAGKSASDSNGNRIISPPGGAHAELEGKPKGTFFGTRKPIKGQPPQQTKDDPADVQLGQPFHYAGTSQIHKNNPCDRYHEYGKNSKKNKGRSKGCDHEAGRMKDATKKTPSSNCQNIVQSKCFQLSGQAGRCYFRVSPSAGNDGSWVLADNCKPVGNTNQLAPGKRRR